MAWLWPVFAVLAALALSLVSPADRPVLAHAALVDATLSTALIVFLLTPRRERTLEPYLGILLRGVALAALAFPEVRQYLWLESLSLLVGGYFIWRGLRVPLPHGFAELDDLERTYAYWLRFSRHPKAHRPVLWELTLLKHLLMRPRLPAGQQFGTRCGATTGSLLTLLAFGSVVEGLLAHVLLERWNVTAAWVWTGLNVLGMIWLLAYGRALSVRPLTLTHRRLYLRSGLHWTGSTPRANVRSADRYSPERDAAALNIAVDVKPNVTLRFVAPVRLLGVYWKEEEVDRVALHVDDPDAFLEALGQGH